MFGLNGLVKTLRRNVVGYLVRTAVKCILWLSPGMASAAGAFIGRFMFYFSATDRRRIDENLRLVYGEKMSSSERRNFARNVCINLGRHVIDAIQLLKMTPYDVCEKVDPNGFDVIIPGILKEGRSVMIVTAHYGNWELLAARIAQMGPLTVLARRNDIPQIEDLITRLRSTHNVRVLDRSDPGAPREMIRMGRDGGHIIGILMDQDTSRIQGIFSDFMGIPALTPSGPASIAIRRLYDVFTGVLIPDSQGNHQICLNGPLDIPDQGTREDQIQAMTDIFNRHISDFIMEKPHFWVWNHRRWRRRPEKESQS